MGKTLKSFTEHLDEQFKDEDVVDTGLIRQLTEHLVSDRIISQEFLQERSMSGLVTGVAGVLAIKGRSLLTKLKSEVERIIASRLSFTAPSITAALEGTGNLYQSQFEYTKHGQWKGSLVRKNIGLDKFINESL